MLTWDEAFAMYNVGIGMKRRSSARGGVVDEGALGGLEIRECGLHMNGEYV